MGSDEQLRNGARQDKLTGRGQEEGPTARLNGDDGFQKVREALRVQCDRNPI